MTACNQQIVNAYEQLGMTVEEIAAHQALAPLSVKAVLMQFSESFRNGVETALTKPSGNEDDECGFSLEEHRLAHDVIVNTARYSEDERLAFKAACYIKDDKKGRLDAIKNIGGLSINVLQFNETLQKAIEAKNRARGVINVESECKAA